MLIVQTAPSKTDPRRTVSPASALVSPMGVTDTALRHQSPFMVFAALLVVGLGWDGAISRPDGVVMLVVLAGFTYYLVRRVQGGQAFDVEADDADDPSLRDWASVVGGLVISSSVRGGPSVADAV